MTIWAMTFFSEVSSLPQTLITCPPRISGIISTAVVVKFSSVFLSSRAACVVVPFVFSSLQ
jgi:hypothetical protein